MSSLITYNFRFITTTSSTYFPLVFLMIFIANSSLSLIKQSLYSWISLIKPSRHANVSWITSIPYDMWSQTYSFINLLTMQHVYFLSCPKHNRTLKITCHKVKAFIKISIPIWKPNPILDLVFLTKFTLVLFLIEVFRTPLLILTKERIHKSLLCMQCTFCMLHTNVVKIMSWLVKSYNFTI